MNATSAAGAPDIGPVLEFLHCRTPQTWIDQALSHRDLLLLDHASLELKAAQQAQRLIWKYGTGKLRGAHELGDAFRSKLVNGMSRLAREELRHFEQVVTLLERRGQSYAAIPPSRYAAGLHALARKDEPGALVDSLIVGAIIEARSCERFQSLVEPLEAVDAELARLYASLLRSEARHFEDYLALARACASETLSARIEIFLDRDAELIGLPDTELRFLSGAMADTAARPA
jgi:tRNA-(ms[2]io[6]A)-hydroxylase